MWDGDGKPVFQDYDENCGRRTSRKPVLRRAI
jgi:hypothetical protein